MGMGCCVWVCTWKFGNSVGYAWVCASMIEEGRGRICGGKAGQGRGMVFDGRHLMQKVLCMCHYPQHVESSRTAVEGLVFFTFFFFKRNISIYR